MSDNTNRSCKITVLYFGAAGTCTGVHSETIELPITQEEAQTSGFPLSRLPPLLISRHSETGLRAVLQTSGWSVDLEMVASLNAVILRGGEEVRSPLTRPVHHRSAEQ